MQNPTIKLVPHDFSPPKFCTSTFFIPFLYCLLSTYYFAVLIVLGANETNFCSDNAQEIYPLTPFLVSEPTSEGYSICKSVIFGHSPEIKLYNSSESLQYSSFIELSLSSSHSDRRGYQRLCFYFGWGVILNCSINIFVFQDR
jgi:hypothetical protein